MKTPFKQKFNSNSPLSQRSITDPINPRPSTNEPSIVSKLLGANPVVAGGKALLDLAKNQIANNIRPVGYGDNPVSRVASAMFKPELGSVSKSGNIKGKSIEERTWDAYPNHIGHSEFNGCFRCHNGNHESEGGRVISRDCNLCHTILAQGNAENFETTSIDMPLEFKHPVDIDEAWKEMACADCHRYLY